MEEDYDQRVPIDHTEWCLGCGSETWRESHSVFHVDIQDQVCNRWKDQGIQIKFHGFSQKEGLDYGMTYSIRQSHVSSKVEVFIEQRTTSAQKDLYKFKRNPYISTFSYIRSLNITQSDEYLNLCYKVEYEIL